MRNAATILFLLLNFPLASQVPDCIPYTAEADFQQNALVIEFRHRNDDDFPADFRAWKVYHGSNKIREHVFYDIAGYSDHSQEALKYRRWSRRMIWMSPIGFIGGVYLYALGQYSAGLTGADSGGYIGGAIMIGSVVILIIGIVRMNRRWAPLELAYPIAEGYNEALIRVLTD